MLAFGVLAVDLAFQSPLAMDAVPLSFLIGIVLLPIAVSLFIVGTIQFGFPKLHVFRNWYVSVAMILWAIGLCYPCFLVLTIAIQDFPAPNADT
jgi:hypothetical protein